MPELIRLSPVRSPREEIEEIERRMKILFKQEIFLPLLRAVGLSRNELTNKKVEGVSPEMSGLFEALSKGEVTFSNGIFSGEFGAQSSKALKKLGARWNPADATFRLNRSELPPEILHAVNLSNQRFSQKMNSVEGKLSQILESKPWTKRNFSDLFDKAIFKMDKDFRQNVKKVSIAPEVSDEAAAKISKEWQNNLEIWIKDFTEKQIAELRGKVKKTYFEGNRYGSLIKTIQDAYGVSARKAEFLARQETHLLVAKYSEARYTEAGFDQYLWRCVIGTPAHPTRPRHKALSAASDRGTTYRWSDPPVTTEPGEPERRNNPGQDFNCRCVPIPIKRAQK